MPSNRCQIIVNIKNRFQYINSEQHYEYLHNYLLPELADIGVDNADEQNDAETELHERSG